MFYPVCFSFVIDFSGHSLPKTSNKFLFTFTHSLSVQEISCLKINTMHIKVTSYILPT